MTTTTSRALAVDHDSPEEVGRRQRLGVILLIVADAAFVLSLVFTYVYLRGLNTQNGWIPDEGGLTMDASFGWVITAVMVLSWVAYRWGTVAAGSQQRARLVLGILTATMLVLLDLVLQSYQLVTAPIRVHDGSYASSWMALSGYHAFHLIITLFIGLGLWNRARLGLFATNAWQVRLAGYWWTWVVISAVLTAATTSLAAVPHAVP